MFVRIWMCIGEGGGERMIELHHPVFYVILASNLDIGGLLTSVT
jgi:hypothetical protein